MALAISAGETALPGAAITLPALKADSERSGLTPIGFSLAFRRLTAKKLIDVVDEMDKHGE
jgi:hypothetical protein